MCALVICRSGIDLNSTAESVLTVSVCIELISQCMKRNGVLIDLPLSCESRRTCTAEICWIACCRIERTRRAWCSWPALESIAGLFGSGHCERWTVNHCNIGWCLYGLRGSRCSCRRVPTWNGCSLRCIVGINGNRVWLYLELCIVCTSCRENRFACNACTCAVEICKCGICVPADESIACWGSCLKSCCGTVSNIFADRCACGVRCYLNSAASAECKGRRIVDITVSISLYGIRIPWPVSGQCNSAGTDTVCRCTCVAVIRQRSIGRCCACRPTVKCITCSWRNRQGERCAVSNIYCGDISGRFLLRRCGCWKRNIAVWSIVVCLAVSKRTDCRLICAVGIEIDYDWIIIQLPLSIERNVPCRHGGWGSKLSAVAVAVWRIFALIPAVECIALASYCCERTLSCFIGYGIKLLIERIFLAVAAWFTSVIHRIGEITDADIRKLDSNPFGSWTETQSCIRPALRNGIISRHSAGCRSRRSNADIIICTCAAISVLRAPWRWWSWCIREYIAVQARRLINSIAIWNLIGMTRNKSHVAGFGRSIILTRRSKVIGNSVGSLLWCKLNWIFMLIYCNRRICVSHRRIRHTEFEIIKVKLILIHEFIFIDSPMSIEGLICVVEIPFAAKQAVTDIDLCTALCLSVPAVECIAGTSGRRKLLNKGVILNIVWENVVIFGIFCRPDCAVTL